MARINADDNLQEVGLYQTDLIVNGKVLVEIKSIEKIIGAHKAQVMNYLSIREFMISAIIRVNPRYPRLIVFVSILGLL